MSFETPGDIKESPLSSEQREAQKMREREILARDHEVAIAEFTAQREAREARRAKAFGIAVSCMDERDTFAADATGEPLGAVELLSSPGGRVTAQDLLRTYGPEIGAARILKQEINIYLLPHKCSDNPHAGCAAFHSDEQALTEYFSKLAADLKSRPEFAGVNIVTAFYDTDSHKLDAVGDSRIPAAAGYARNRLVEKVGVSRKDAVGAADQAHSGNRIYVGDVPRAWTARRNAAYHLSPGMETEELLEGIALAVKVIKTHSHVNLREQPVVIQLDRTPDGDSAVALSDAELLARLNASPLLKGNELTADELLVVRTETDAETWQANENELVAKRRTA